VQNLNKNTQLRVDTSSYFSSVKKNARVIKESSDLTKLPLGLDAYKLYKKERKKISDESKVKDVATDDIEIGFNKLDMYTAATDTILKTRLKKFKENTEKDHYVRESLRVLSEIVKK
jgi:hypothetical protein